MLCYKCLMNGSISVVPQHFFFFAPDLNIDIYMVLVINFIRDNINFQGL
ncbi:hypothetical protein CLORY_25420 [Clostridium oryzae]|uniref:Uncharacterized protein n=1 Tax=Clostridium oryzae TaxID=1450648 RepID=A0A1V4IM79_9CLOT|nr:hypothetical protein CLORY_25420 [Clostridium oryzae]